MKTNKISLLFISVLLLASIGGASAYYKENIINFKGESHFSCHGTNPDGDWVEYSINGVVNISGAPATVYALQEFTLTAWVENMTEVDENQDRDGDLTIGISGQLADNGAFLRGLDELAYDQIDTYNSSWNRGSTISSVTFTLTAPETPAQYTLMVTAMNGENSTDSYMWFLVANGTVIIDVLANPPAAAGLASSGDGDGGDRDLWKEETIPGYILIITIASILSVSAILILRIKKLKRSTIRNV